MAIDGPTAAGKSTVARAVARRLGFLYVDTGAMYRSVALVALRRGIPLTHAEELTRLAESLALEIRALPSGNRVIVDGEDVTEAIRVPEVSVASSQVSAIAGVRAAMVAWQRTLAREGGVVMEGRDIGTIVLPDAEVKVFLDANLEARARRRYAELQARGITADFDDVRRQETERDLRDTTRDLSPLRPAADAMIVDTTAQTVEDVVADVIRVVQERTDAV